MLEKILMAHNSLSLSLKHPISMESMSFSEELKKDLKFAKESRSSDVIARTNQQKKLK